MDRPVGDAGGMLQSWLEAIPSRWRRWLVVSHDLLAAYASFWIAVFLRYGDLHIGERGVAGLHAFIPLFLLFFLAASGWLKMHLGMWRYTSSTELVTIVKAVTLSITTFFLAAFLIHRLEGVPRSLPLIHWFVLVFMLGGSRFAYRLMRSGTASGLLSLASGRSHVTPVLLVGSGTGTSSFIRLVHQGFDPLYRAVGVIDLDGSGRGRRIHDVPVLGSLDDVDDIVALLETRGDRPTRLVVTDSFSPDIMRQLVKTANRLNLVLSRVPAPVEFREALAEDGRIELRPVALEDLLGRPQARLDRLAIEELIVGRRVLVTGAGGSIGSELVRQIADRDPAELILLDHSEFNLYSIDHEIGERTPNIVRHALLCNVRSRKRVADIFRRHRPELVFHAAALKHVPMVEGNPCEGVLTNAIGTRNVADAARQHGVLAFIQVSTDKAVNPTNVMGASKRLAEFYVQALDLASRGAGGPGKAPRFMTVRFGNVLGSSGSVVPLFQRQLERGGPLTVTHPEIERFFMTIPEAVLLVLHASAHGIRHDDERGQIFVLDMGKPIRIVDVARQMIRLAGREPGKDIEIRFTGLRPGEKLYEELFDDEENRLQPALSGVFTATSCPMPLDELATLFAGLEKACDSHDETEVRRIIASTIPGYVCPGSDR